jgi:hypothetical protein
MCFAIAKSSSSFFSSNITKNKSKRDIIGGEISTFHLKDLVLSYLPLNGFAAARIDVLAFKVAWIPAFAIEIVCYSIASWIAT